MTIENSNLERRSDVMAQARKVRSRPAGLLLAAVMLTVIGCHQSSPANTSPAASSMGALETGVNRRGRDLAEFGVRAADAATCARLCAEEAQCKAMSYMERPAPDTGICWLKGSVPDPTPNPTMVSAVKVAP